MHPTARKYIFRLYRRPRPGRPCSAWIKDADLPMRTAPMLRPRRPCNIPLSPAVSPVKLDFLQCGLPLASAPCYCQFYCSVPTNFELCSLWPIRLVHPTQNLARAFHPSPQQFGGDAEVLTAEVPRTVLRMSLRLSSS
jgi:hypothetical protein